MYCALPAIALGKRFGIPQRDIADALRSIEPGPMRGGIHTKKGVRFVLDCYNANPSSMKAGISLLTDVARGGPTTAIVGDMLELGSYSARLHRALGRQLARAGIDRIVAVGRFADRIAAGAREAGLPASALRCAATAGEAVERVRGFVKRGDTVLLKGSRGVKLEQVYEGF
jgi:UDP-N-acetylmuramoyl-tripeptide--D-alanyl-D-alanine ligase